MSRDRIVHVSCNPSTLARDRKYLTASKRSSAGGYVSMDGTRGDGDIDNKGLERGFWKGLI
jgi:hypothetical protein